MNKYQLILASTSTYRAELLNKLKMPFQTLAPECDETPLPKESASELVSRLAKAKAENCSLPNRPCLVIGSDQVCVIDGHIQGKPLTEKNAVEQLMQQSSRSITFYTGIALHNSVTGSTEIEVETFKVNFRDFTREEAEYYVSVEQPLWCAGSFKSEGLGITLFHSLEGRDPNTLIGLPLIVLTQLLGRQGVQVLSDHSQLIDCEVS